MKKRPIKSIQTRAARRDALARSPADGKRHDRVKGVERRDMNGMFAYYLADGIDEDEAIKKVARDLMRDPETVKLHLVKAKQPEPDKPPQRIEKDLIAEIMKLAQRLEQLTYVPKPETPLLPDDKQTEDEIVRAGMRGNTHPLLSVMITGMQTPWWCATGPVEIRRHLRWEQEALFNRFIGLATSQGFNATLSDWEQKANRYLWLKQAKAPASKIQAAYQEAKQAEYALHSDLWNAFEALRWGTVGGTGVDLGNF